jgi:hypothetical protein
MQMEIQMAITIWSCLLYLDWSDAMTPDEFRDLALQLPEAVEAEHMDHPDFRVGGKIFATLGAPDAAWGMLKLTPEQQEQWIDAEPDVLAPVKGGWGRRGATNVRLAAATAKKLRRALVDAWKNVAPKRLVKLHEDL